MEQDFQAKPPLYTQEDTIERQILDGAEAFFNQRDENLRFDIVKRVFQWMLDTDENGWFERTQDSLRDIEKMRRPYIRRGNIEVDEYMRVMANDTAQERLTEELTATSDYLDQIEEMIPEKYLRRHQFVQDSAQEYYAYAQRRKDFFGSKEYGVWTEQATRRLYRDVNFGENSPL